MTKPLLRLGGVLVLLLAFLPSVFAQSGVKVARIDIKHVGPQSASDELIRANIRTKSGDAYSVQAIDEDVKNLYATGFFYNIQVLDKREAEGVVLTYVVQGKPRLTDVKFSGNKKYSDTKLRKKLTSKTGFPLDEHKLFADAQEIKKMYQKAGYPNTDVKYVLAIDESGGTGTARFEIKESPRIKIEKVEFVGAQAFSQRKLRKVVKTRKRWMFSWLTGSGRLKDDQLQEDRERLGEFYRDRGYIDFELKDIKVENTSRNKVAVKFLVSEGKPYKVGSVKFTGNKLFSEKDIASGLQQLRTFKGTKAKLGPHGLSMDVGDTFTPKGMTRDVESVEDFYGSKGYIDVNQSTGNLQVRRIPNTDTGTMDVEFVIDEGQQAYIEKIEIRGNSKTKDKVLRRELAVTPGETFNMVRVKLSKSRLEGLQYFEKVEMRPEPTDVPNRRDLIVAVEEKNTGNFTLGAGFSSVDAIVGFIEVSQGNFDLFKPPTFTGGGQKFRLRVQLGTERQDYIISFVEPWFLGKKLALGVDLYHRDLNFQSIGNLYDEVRTGARVSLTRALYRDFLIGSVSYTLENIGIILDPSVHRDQPADGGVPGELPPISKQNAPNALFNEAGYSLVSKFGFSLAYDTRNSVLLPNKGQRTELSAEVAGGPISDKNFYKVELRSGWYFPGFSQGHVLEVIGLAGVADSLDNHDVPFYERFYLGGVNSLRGFRYRDVSPREPGFDEPIGGDTYWFGSLEYSIPIVERVRFAAFYDIGNVLADSYDFSFSDFADNYGVGIRLNLPIGPLRLDYGIPIHHPDDTSGSGKFQFSVGYSRPL
jgi:outer membrane protein insertion porin family